MNESTTSTANKSLALVAVVLCIAFTVTGQVFLATNRLNDADSSFFLYGGRLLLEGGGLYKEWWDQKPPGIFYQNFLLLKLFGDNFVTWAVVHGIAQLLVAFFVFRSLRSFFSLRSRLLFVVLFCWAFSLNNWIDSGNRPEYALSLLEALAFCFLVRFLGSENRRLLAGAGICSALAFWFKPVGMASYLAACAFFLIPLFPTKSRLRDFSWLSAGFWGLHLIVSLFLFSRGILADSLDAALLTPLQLADQSAPGYPAAAKNALFAYGPLWGFLMWAPASLFAFARLERRQKIFLAAVSLFCLASLAGVIVQRRASPHYYHQGVFPLMILAFSSLFFALKGLKQHLKTLIVLSFVLTGAVYARWATVRQFRFALNRPQYERSLRAYEELADYIKPRLKKDETIYYWAMGYQPYLLAGIKTPSMYSPNLLVLGDAGAERIKGDLRRVFGKNPPAFVILPRRNRDLPLRLWAPSRNTPFSEKQKNVYQFLSGKIQNDYEKVESPEAPEEFLIFKRKDYSTKM